MSPFDVRRFDPPLTLPTIESGPVLLRAFELHDAGLVVEASADPAITRVSSMEPHSSAAAALTFVERQRTLAEEGHGYSLVVALSEQPHRGVGSVALWLRDIETGRASVGYWLVQSARGQGLGSWAVRGLVRYAFEEFEIPRLEVDIEPQNETSIRVATSVGFLRTGSGPTANGEDSRDDPGVLRFSLEIGRGAI
jgi:ribosomal-protein-alanine N-acetyltransferase